MRGIVRIAVAAAWALGVGAVGGAGGAAAAEVRVGEVLSTQARGGTPLREAPTGLAKALKVLPYATRVQVQEVLGFHARVTIEDGTLGWVRTADLVAPLALTAAGPHKPVGAGGFTAAEISAAGRQFDAKTERTVQEMDRDLSPAYAKVDVVEASSASEADVDAFVLEGSLGRCGDQPVQSLTSPPMARPVSPWRGHAVHVATPRVASDYVARMRDDFSPEQEYWLGRSVAAAAIAQYGLDPDPDRQAAVARIGATLVRLSNRLNGTYGGYHFAVLDTPVANGVSGPGGFVLVTRGALERARDEDEVAGIVAHELAHVGLKHGEKVVRHDRAFQASLRQLEALAVTEPPGGECKVLCGEVARVLGETAKGLVRTLTTGDGYGKDFELQADWEGSLLLCEAGYQVGSISRYLETSPERPDTHWDTHPAPAERIAALKMIVDRHAAVGTEGYEARCARHAKLMKRDALPPPRPAPTSGADR